MDLLYFLLLIVIVVFLFVIFLKILKSIFKAVIFIIIVFSLIILIFGLFVYYDATRFQEKFPNEYKKFILKEDDVLLTGFRTKDLGDFIYFDSDGLKKIQEAYYKKEFNLVLESDYKMIFFDLLSFESILNGSILIKNYNKNFTKAEVIMILTSNNSMEKLNEILYENLNDSVKAQLSFKEFNITMDEKLVSDEQVRAMIFGVLLGKAMEKNYLNFIIAGIRGKTIIIYPESIMFMTIKHAPDFVMNAVVLQEK